MERGQHLAQVSSMPGGGDVCDSFFFLSSWVCVPKAVTPSCLLVSSPGRPRKDSGNLDSGPASECYPPGYAVSPFVAPLCPVPLMGPPVLAIRKYQLDPA